MGKKNFTAATDDIFGGFAAEKTPENPQEQKQKAKKKLPKKEYELYLLAVEKGQLNAMQAWAANRDIEVKGLLEEILEEKLATVKNLPAMLDAYKKEH